MSALGCRCMINTLYCVNSVNKWLNTTPSIFYAALLLASGCPVSLLSMSYFCRHGQAALHNAHSPVGTVLATGFVTARLEYRHIGQASKAGL